MKKGIVNHLRQDPGSVATTMVDYYALPQGASGWPGRSIATGDSEAKASRAEFSIATEITEAMGYGFNPARFVPYVVMHEFEALLFSDCAAFSEGIGQAGTGREVAVGEE